MTWGQTSHLDPFVSIDTHLYPAISRCISIYLYPQCIYIYIQVFLNLYFYLIYVAEFLMFISTYIYLSKRSSIQSSNLSILQPVKLSIYQSVFHLFVHIYIYIVISVYVSSIYLYLSIFSLISIDIHIYIFLYKPLPTSTSVDYFV